MWKYKPHAVVRYKLYLGTIWGTCTVFYINISIWCYFVYVAFHRNIYFYHYLIVQLLSYLLVYRSRFFYRKHIWSVYITFTVKDYPSLYKGLLYIFLVIYLYFNEWKILWSDIIFKITKCLISHKHLKYFWMLLLVSSSECFNCDVWSGRRSLWGCLKCLHPGTPFRSPLLLITI